MTKGKIIAYAINKECCRWSLKEWCGSWDITVEEFKKFLEIGSAAYDGTLEIQKKLGQKGKKNDND